ncbi:hypothetical protein [Paenibacillus tyrfis]|uniref:hypothetical protein n=1 Tax=Paenibacillus tyrfis TaxID=1501230 RepID=UPI000B596B4B|nr:hypothetical protein [Paenibacillus tyrfis]
MSNHKSHRAGPAYLEGVTIAEKPENWMEQEWTGKLQTKEGRTQFRIYYYGELMDDLIAVTDFAPQLIVAEDPVDGERYLLFDGCKHGYNAMLCDTYTAEQQNNRTPLLPYLDKDGEDTFEVYITAFYNVDWDEEFADDVDEDGQLELISGERVDFDEAKRNGYDALGIDIVNNKGVKIEIVQEELA